MNLEQEIRNGYVVTREAKLLWDLQLRMVRKLIDVCQKHGLRIWAVGGTLLGAVRHHGYIPWDDDIDMGMPRPDYDKLVSIASDEFKDPYFLQTGYTDQLYPRGHGQLRFRGTTAMLPYDICARFDQSVFIDIFIFDGLPGTRDDLENQLVKSLAIRDLLFQIAYFQFSYTHPILSIRRNMELRRILKGKGFTGLFREYEDCFRKNKYEEAHEIGWIAYCYKEKFIWEKAWYSGTKWLPFEDVEMPVPSEYDKVLERQYGDYMKPCNVPTDHGGYLILDLNRSYLYHLSRVRFCGFLERAKSRFLRVWKHSKK